MREMRAWSAVLIEQLVERGNVTGFLQAVMEEYQTYGDTPAVLIALESAVEAQGGISKLTERTHIEPQVLLKILSGEKAPRIDTLRTILTALGCRLSIEPLECENSRLEIKNEDPSVKPRTDANHSIEVATDNQ